MDIQVVLTYGLTSSNWWGIITSIPIHFWVFEDHLLPNIEGILLATFLYIFLFYANTFGRARQSSIVFGLVSFYGAILGDAALYFLMPPGEIAFGMSGIVLGMGGIDLALAIVGAIKAGRANRLPH